MRMSRTAGGRFHCRRSFGPAFLAGACALLGGAVPARAAVWESPVWVLRGETAGLIGYDSNLTARNDGPEDGFVRLEPRLTLARRASLTRLEISAGARGTMFFSEEDFNAVDPMFHALWRYPLLDDEPPAHAIDLGWGRRSDADADLGRRVRSERWNAQWQGRLHQSGKLGWLGRFDAHSTDYREVDLNTNESFALGTTVDYAVGEKLHFGAGYDREWARSRGGAGRPDTRSGQDAVSLRARGELGPTLTGTVHGGVAFIDYRGAVDRRDREWIGAVALTWRPAALTTTEIRASRRAEFSPEGETALRSGLDLDLAREFAQGFRLRGGGGVSRVDRDTAPSAYEATAVTLRTALEYVRDRAFSAGVGYEWTEQYATPADRDFERHLVNASVRLLF